jgi:DNA-binding FadR family transcriptional regulator
VTRKADLKLLTLAGAMRQQEKPGVARSVVNRILDLIRTDMLRAGDRLPSERELIEILDISRPSLREALRALSMLGVIESRHGGSRRSISFSPCPRPIWPTPSKAGASSKWRSRARPPGRRPPTSSMT